MKARKKLTLKDWIISFLVIFMFLGAIALPARLLSKNDNIDDSSDKPSVDIPIEDELDVDVNGIRLNKSEILF